MAAIDVVNRVLREFKRFTGDGLPGEPINAPLPVGDPQSGAHSPKKSELRQALIAPIADAEIWANASAQSAADAQGGLGKPFESIAQAMLYRPVTAPQFIQTANNIVGDGVQRTWGYYGTSAPGHERYIQITLDDGVTVVYYLSTAQAYVIGATGQSNMALYGAVAWDVPGNLKRWNWSAIDGEVGDDFIPVPSDNANVAWSYAAEVAWAHPEWDVFVVNVAIGGLLIAQWKSDATTPRMFSNCVNNFEAAIAWAGVTKIDELLWWQGEGDWNSTTYFDDWSTVYSRFLGESWFPYSTPITLFGISTHGTPNLGEFFNANLARLSAHWASVSFYNTGSMPIGYWDPTDDYVHANAQGFLFAGRMAYTRSIKESPGAWVNPYYGSLHVSGNTIMGPRALQRRGDQSTTPGVGRVTSFDGSQMSFTAGTGASIHQYFLNDADVVPTVVGSIVTTGSATGLNTSSGRALKDDDGEMPIEAAMDILRMVNIHSFRWKRDGVEDVGVFAEELYEVYPDAVTPGFTTSDGVVIPWAVNYQRLIVPLFRAVQGIDTRLKALETA